MAALEEGVITPTSTIVDDGEFELGDRVLQNARDAVLGALQLPQRAHGVLGHLLLPARPRHERERPGAAGVGAAARHRAATGIDIPGEFAGLVPDSEWRDKGYDEYLRCAKKAKVEPGTTAALFECGGIERTWTAGDNVNLAVGQGDLQATPLQLAHAYSTIIDDGKVVRPHLGMRVEDGHGVLLEEIRTPARRRVGFDPGTATRSWPACTARRRRPTARRATCSPTSSTATSCTARPAPPSAQPNPDQSWYACYVDDPTSRSWSSTTIERGGFGAETAAPAARLILNEWFDLRDHEFTAGSDQSQLSTHPIQPASEPPPPLVPREWQLRLDPLLLLATLGLVRLADRARRGDRERHPGRPELLRPPPGGLRGGRAGADVRGVADRLLAAAGAALPDLRAAAGVILSCSGSRGPRAAPSRGSSCRASTSSRPSSARCCSSWRCRRSWSTACAAWDGTRRRGSCCSACSRRCSSSPSRTSGSALVYVAGTLALLFVAGAPWRHFAALGALFAVASRSCSWSRRGRACTCSSRTRSSA